MPRLIALESWTGTPGTAALNEPLLVEMSEEGPSVRTPPPGGGSDAGPTDALDPAFAPGRPVSFGGPPASEVVPAGAAPAGRDRADETSPGPVALAPRLFPSAPWVAGFVGRPAPPSFPLSFWTGGSPSLCLFSDSFIGKVCHDIPFSRTESCD